MSRHVSPGRTGLLFAMLLAAGCSSAPTDPGDGFSPSFVEAGSDTTVSSILVVSVTAPDLATPWVFYFPIGAGVASGTVDLPLGKARVFTALVYALDGTELNRGSAKVDIVSGANPAVTIHAAAHYRGNPTIVAQLGVRGHTPLGSITVAGIPASLGPGQTATAKATHIDPKFGPLANANPTLASQDPARLTVDSKGYLIPHGSGSVLVVATWQGLATARVNVTVTGFGWKDISVGNITTCGVLASNGALYCWGRPIIGGTPPSATPVFISGGVSLATVDLGYEGGCGLSAAGDVYCWGDGYRGSTTASPGAGPTLVNIPGHHFTAVSMGWSHACAIATTGEAYCWGDNTSGELGVSPASTPNGMTSTPVLVQTGAGERFSTLSAGLEFTCGVTTTGFLYCWGLNSVGQLGTGDQVSTWHPTPVAVVGTSFAVAAGYAYNKQSPACALGQTPVWIFCWGSNDQGVLGTGSSVPFTTAPSSLVALSPEPGMISIGYSAACVAGTTTVPSAAVNVLTPPVSAYCWGDGRFGELGDGAGVSRWLPSAVSLSNAFARVNIGLEHACAVTRVGAGYCWGDGHEGEVGGGIGGQYGTLVPRRVPAP